MPLSVTNPPLTPRHSNCDSFDLSRSLLRNEKRHFGVKWLRRTVVDYPEQSGWFGIRHKALSMDLVRGNSMPKCWFGGRIPDVEIIQVNYRVVMGFDNLKKPMLWFYSNYIFANTEMAAHMADRLTPIIVFKNYPVRNTVDMPLFWLLRNPKLVKIRHIVKIRAYTPLFWQKRAYKNAFRINYVKRPS